jgi:hypothetical protein
MIVRFLHNGQKTQAFVSPGTVQCALCKTIIPPNEYYTRHQAKVPATLWNPSPRLTIYYLCYQDAPFRKETEEEQKYATQPIQVPPAINTHMHIKEEIAFSLSL